MNDEITSTAGATAELRWGAATSSGRIREGNEDNYLADDEVFVIADGMGGHQAGEVAAEIATSTLGDRLRAGARSSGVVVAAAIEANAAIFQAAHSNPDQRGMGTTVTAIVRLRALDEATQPLHRPIEAGPAPTDDERPAGVAVVDPDDPDGTLIATPAVDLAEVDPSADDNTVFDEAIIDEPAATAPAVAPDADARLVVINVGDSRIYVSRHRQLKRVTIDHSYVQELLATGHITEAEARHHPRRNIVTRALGIEPTVRVDSWTVPMVRGDRYLLCSDGLVDEVDDDEINAILLANDDPEQCATALVEAANASGGRDNTTVIVLDVLAGQEPPADGDAALTGELDRAVPDWADDEPNRLIDADRATTVLPRTAAAGTPAPRRRRITVGSVLFTLALLAIAAGVIFAIVNSNRDDEGPVTSTIVTTTTTSTTSTSTTTVAETVVTAATSAPAAPATSAAADVTSTAGG